jgi:ribosomal-protein-alanine N-acetyltransferase
VNIHVPGAGSPGGKPPGDKNRSAIDWRAGLPPLVGERVTLRELEVSDASNLYAELSSPEARKYMWAPPPNVVAFERFIEWTHGERHSGKYICYGVVPQGRNEAWGVFELRQLQPGFLRGELGFVIAPSYWGSGVFYEGANLLLDFAFNTVKVHRIEARAAVDNERSNAALEKIGASREGTLKDAFWREDQFIDQYLWAILDSDWRDKNDKSRA